MKWSIKLAEVRGIGIYVHATFVIIVAWVALVHWNAEQTLEAVVDGVVFILALFACVVLHELGHALSAQRYGIRTRDITLLPIGGVARLERMPEEPLQELVVALAGPAVNVVIAAALWVWIAATGPLASAAELGVNAGPFLERLMVVNIFLVLFNLLPAFPMDGGRVLRALLATRLDYTRATEVAAVVGQGMALLFGFIGLFWNPILLFIALFVWVGASQEATMVQMRTSFAGIPVSQAMLTDFEALAPEDDLARAVDLTLAGSQKDFPVVDAGAVVGVLTQHDLLSALSARSRDTPVSAVMRTDFQFIEAPEMLERAFQRLQACDCSTMPVVREGRIVGLLTMDNVGEFVRIQSALGSGRP